MQERNTFIASAGPAASTTIDAIADKATTSAANGSGFCYEDFERTSAIEDEKAWNNLVDTVEVRKRTAKLAAKVNKLNAADGKTNEKAASFEAMRYS